MDSSQNPEMQDQDVIDDFCDESLTLLDELEDILDTLEENVQNTKVLEDFGQIIDRIMGAAKSIGAKKIGTMCELGKTIGYKASQATLDAKMMDVVVAVLFDNVEVVRQMVNKVKEGKGEGVQGLDSDALVSRLRWLSDKFSHIKRSSVDFGQEGESSAADQETIDKLLADLGL